MRSANQFLSLVARRLTGRYRDFDHYNRRNPLDELVFILLSQMTTEPSYRRTFRKFKAQFPSVRHLSDATRLQIRRTIAGAGLEERKSQAIYDVVARLKVTFGRPTLAPLNKLSDEECEIFLTSLPHVGKKTARCVMMYSLDRAVFPVDVHCWRISRRLGLFDSDGAHPTQNQMDELQEIIPRGLRYSLHVNFVSLGRDACMAKTARCSDCVLADICPASASASKAT